MKNLLLLIPLVLSSVFCSIDFSSAGSPTPDVAQMVSTTLTALAAQVPATEAAPPTAEPTLAVIIPTAAPALGTISGNLMFPSSFVPALRIVAFPVAGGTPVIIATVDGQSTYEMQLPAGQYYIVAYIPDGSYAGGYSAAVPCGLSVDCPDHSLLVVTVLAGQATTNIVPGDFYAPEGAFPPMP